MFAALCLLSLYPQNSPANPCKKAVEIYSNIWYHDFKQEFNCLILLINRISYKEWWYAPKESFFLCAKKTKIKLYRGVNNK